MNGAEMVRAEALARRFGEVTAVGGVSLSIAAREWVSLIGPSGCGKTTLLQMLGLLDRPTAGRLTLAGVDPWETSPRTAGLRISGQQPDRSPDGARERRPSSVAAPGTTSRRARRRRCAPRTAGTLLARRDARRRSFDGRSAARGDCPRPRQPSRIGPRRRTHRQPRLGVDQNRDGRVRGGMHRWICAAGRHARRGRGPSRQPDSCDVRWTPRRLVRTRRRRPPRSSPRSCRNCRRKRGTPPRLRSPRTCPRGPRRNGADNHRASPAARSR